VQSGSAGLTSFEKDTGPNDAPHALELPCTHLSFAQPQQPAGYIGKFAPLPADHGCLAPRGLATAIQEHRSGLLLFSGCLLSPSDPVRHCRQSGYAGFGATSPNSDLFATREAGVGKREIGGSCTIVHEFVGYGANSTAM
jgi:hypothetical protein